MATNTKGRSLKQVFRREKLLLAKRKGGSMQLWSTSDQVFRDCPTFVFFTPQVIETRSAYSYHWLCQQLDLPTWNHEKNLKVELERGVTEMKESSENWRLIQQYVFEALESMLPMLPEPVNSSRSSWISAILQLPVFPVTASNDSKTIKSLSESIFVPDSELLNDHFKGKVDILDFGDNHIWDILRVLRWSTVQLKYLSDYNKTETMEMRVMPPEQEDAKLTDLIRSKRSALTR